MKKFDIHLIFFINNLQMSIFSISLPFIRIYDKPNLYQSQISKMNTYIFGFDIMYNIECNIENIFIAYNDDIICQIYPKLIYENKSVKYYKINIKDIFTDMEIFPIYKIRDNISLRFTGYKLSGISIVQHGYNYYNIKIPESVYISSYNSIIAILISNIQNNTIYFGDHDISIGEISINIKSRYNVMGIMLNNKRIEYNISNGEIYTLLLGDKITIKDAEIRIISPNKISNAIIYMTQYLNIKIYDNGNITFRKYGEYLLKTC